MGIMEDALAAAIGYSVASSKNSKVVGDIIDNNIKSMTLEDIVANYARRHLEIYTVNNEFAHRLHKIAEKYEEYNYNQVYGDGY